MLMSTAPTYLRLSKTTYHDCSSKKTLWKKKKYQILY